MESNHEKNAENDLRDAPGKGLSKLIAWAEGEEMDLDSPQSASGNAEPEVLKNDSSDAND